MNRNNEPPSLLEVVIGAAIVIGGLWALSKGIKEEEAKNEPVWVPPYRPPSPPEVRVVRQAVQEYDPDADEGDPDDCMN